MAAEEPVPQPEDEEDNGSHEYEGLDDDAYTPICEADFDDSEMDQWFKAVFFAWRDEFDRQQADYVDPDEPQPAEAPRDGQAAQDA